MRSFPSTALAVFSLLAFSPPGFGQPAKSDPVRAAIEKQNAAFSAAFGRGDISSSLAAETGTATLTIQPPSGAEQSQKVKYVVVWQKQPDGTWKLYRDIWNAMPASAQ
jgi:hypothetical protein